MDDIYKPYLTTDETRYNELVIVADFRMVSNNARHIGGHVRSLDSSSLERPISIISSNDKLIAQYARSGWFLKRVIVCAIFLFSVLKVSTPNYLSRLFPLASLKGTSTVVEN